MFFQRSVWWPLPFHLSCLLMTHTRQKAGPNSKLQKAIVGLYADGFHLTLHDAICPIGLTSHNVSVTSQSALEFCPIHCPNGRLGQDLDFGGFALALKLPELLNTNLAAVRAKLGQTSCFPNGPQIWCPIGQ